MFIKGVLLLAFLGVYWAHEENNNGNITSQYGNNISGNNFSYQWRLFNSFYNSSNNLSYNLGIVQVRRSDSITWGTVCDDGFNSSTATVICKWLGFKRAYSFNNTGSGYTLSSPIFLDNLVCNTGARNLSECSHNGWGKHNCGHNEDIVLACTNSEQNSVIALSYQWRLYNSSYNSGIVQVRRSDNLTWGTVCDDGFNNDTANVICKWLGFRRAHSFSASKSSALSSPIFLDNLVCNTGTRNLSECSHNGWGKHDCNHREDVVLHCTNSVCYFPNYITNGRYVRTINATTVQYQCNSYYVFTANSTDGHGTCEKGVVRLPSCIYDSCRNIGYPSYITNGRRTYIYNPNYQYAYYCYTGYMISENSTYQWYSGRVYGLPSCSYGTTNIPTCVRNRCNSTIPNGYSSYGYYNCSEGYELEDPNVFKCGEGNYLVEPKCDPKDCYYPNYISNGKLVNNNTYNNTYNATDYEEYDGNDTVPIQYYCYTGYKMAQNISNGTGMAPCIDGTRIIPVCEVDGCYKVEYAVNITNGYLNTSTTTQFYKGRSYAYRYYPYQYGYRSKDNTSVQYICDKGYKLHQNSSDGLAVCEDDTIRYPTCVHEMDVMLMKKGSGHQVKVSFDNKTWASICDDSWGENDANVVCRSLGWKGGLPLSLRSKDMIKVTSFNCTGRENSLGLCPYADYPSKYALPCKSNEVAGVKCYHEDWTFKTLIKRARLKTRKLMTMITISFKIIVKKFDVSYKMDDQLVPQFYDSNKTQQFSAYMKHNNKSGMYKARLVINSFNEQPCLILMVTMPLFERSSQTNFCLNGAERNTTLTIYNKKQT